MITQKNPQVNQAVMRLAELSADEQTRLLYESRQKMEWDNQARERGARSEGRVEGRAEERSEVARNALEGLRAATDERTATQHSRHLSERGGHDVLPAFRVWASKDKRSARAM